MTKLQIVSPADQSTVLWDFNDPAGTAAWAADLGGVKTYGFLGGGFELLSPVLEAYRFEAVERDGGLTAFVRRPLTTSSLRMRLLATSTANMLAAIARLQYLMEQGGVMLYELVAGETRYIDFEPSPAPALLDGKALELHAVSTLFDTPEGVTIGFVRQPWLRGPELDPNVNRLQNSTLLGDAGGNGVPDKWTSVAGTHSIVAADEAYQNSHTAISDLIYQDFATGTNGTWRLSGYARRVSGAGEAVLRVASVGGAGTADSSPITSSAWQRFSVSVATSGVTTAIRATLRQSAASGTTVFQFRNLQLELNGTGITPYRPGVEVMNVDPAAAGLAYVMPVYAHGSMRTPARVQIQANLAGVHDGQWGVRSRSPVVGDHALVTYLNAAKFSQCESWTMDIADTTVAAEAGGSPQTGNTIAQTTFATSAAHVARCHATISDQAVLGALKGSTWRVYLRAGSSALSTTYTLQLKWSWGGVYSGNAEQIVTWTPAMAAYTDTYMGTITLPDEQPASFGIYLHAGRSSGAGTLRSDFLIFLPAESAGEVVASSGLSASTGWTEVDGEEDEVRVLNSSLLVSKVANELEPIDIRGNMPILRPGLNLLHARLMNVENNIITTTMKVGVFYSPRYHA